MIAALSFNRPAMHASGVFPIPASYGVSIAGERLYDAWGGVRAGQSHGYPYHRYCANLGHIADDETGLTYMRARSYEPSTGRFISEDPAMDGRNWYVYCWNDPIQKVDFNGKTAVAVVLLHGVVSAIGGVLGVLAARTLWAHMIQQSIKNGRSDQDAMDRIVRVYNSSVLEIYGSLTSIVTGGLTALGMSTSAVSTAGSYGLAFAVGFAIALMVTFNSMLILAAVDSAGYTSGESSQ